MTAPTPAGACLPSPSGDADPPDGQTARAATSPAARAFLRGWVLRKMMRVAQSREPDFIIGNRADPYLRRWWIIPRNRVFNIYLHHFCRSDDDRALHDHPWVNLSWLLDGTYLEHSPNGIAERRSGQMVARLPSAAHRVQLLVSDTGREKPVWTLFITGPRVREWGFLCPRGWRHWKEFTARDDKGQVGRGCE